MDRHYLCIFHLNNISIWNANTGVLYYHLKLPTKYADLVLPSKTVNLVMNYPILAVGMEDGKFLVFRIQDGQAVCMGELRDDQLDTHGLTYAPGGLLVAKTTIVTNGAFPDEFMVWFLPEYESQANESHSSRRVEPEYASVNLFKNSKLSNLAVPPREPMSNLVHFNSFSISETKAFARNNLSVPPFRDVKRIETDEDSTMLFACSLHTGEDLEYCLLMWDFRVYRKNRWVDKYLVGSREVFLCYEEI
jgi:hypothetical protein